MRKTIVTRTLTKEEYQNLRDEAKKFGLKINIRNVRGYVSVYPTASDREWTIDQLYAVYTFLNAQDMFMFESYPVTSFQRFATGFTNLSKVVNKDSVTVNKVYEVEEQETKSNKTNVIQFPLHRVKTKAQ